MQSVCTLAERLQLWSIWRRADFSQSRRALDVTTRHPSYPQRSTLALLVTITSAVDRHLTSGNRANSSHTYFCYIALSFCVVVCHYPQRAFCKREISQDVEIVHCIKVSRIMGFNTLKCKLCTCKELDCLLIVRLAVK